jgi:hypothetical protein
MCVAISPNQAIRWYSRIVWPEYTGEGLFESKAGIRVLNLPILCSNQREQPSLCQLQGVA